MADREYAEGEELKMLQKIGAAFRNKGLYVFSLRCVSDAFGVRRYWLNLGGFNKVSNQIMGWKTKEELEELVRTVKK